MSEKCECVNVRKVVIVGCGFVGVSVCAYAKRTFFGNGID